MKKTIIKSLISILLIGFLFTQVVSFKEVLKTFSQINLFYFFLAFVAVIGNNVVSTARWQYLIDHSKVKYWYLFRLYFIGNYFNNSFEIIDVSDPSNPVLVKTVLHGDNGLDLRRINFVKILP